MLFILQKKIHYKILLVLYFKLQTFYSITFMSETCLNEGENGPRVRDLASDATRSTLLVISPEHAEVEVIHLKDFDSF
jgi:hypothetical protein